MRPPPKVAESDLSDISDQDELADESEASLSNGASDHDETMDELDSDASADYDQLEVDELMQDEDFGSFVQSRQPKAKKHKGKLIHFDPVNIPKGEKTLGMIEKFVSYRMLEGVEQLLVKYKNTSFHDCDWIDRTVLESDKNAKNRVRRFLEKPIWDTQYSDDEPFNPAYLKVDRLIDDGELDGELHFLVKWCNQSYDAATWENATFIRSLDEDKVDEFYNSKILTSEKEASYASTKAKRTPFSKFTQLQESPVFKSENTLRSYQLEGLNWLAYCWYKGQNSILADEMGLGKTIQSTAFLNLLFTQENIKGPFLIVVPLSTMGNWEREIRGWTEMNVVTFHGNQTARNLIIDTEFYFRDDEGTPIPGIFKFDIILTTYEIVMSAATQLRPIKWRCAVLDEAHKLKNKSSKICEFLKSYSMAHRVLLTGTPLQNSLDELWALLNFLEPEKFPSERDFITNYGSMSSAADVEKLQALLKPLMLRRLKEDVEKAIPVKEETIVEVELTTTQKKWYRSILEKNFSWLKQGGKRSNVPNLINTMIELRKCCIHPWLLNGAEDQILEELHADTAETQAKALIQSSGKMVLIDKLLKKLKAGGHKVLIFSQMTKCLDLIQEYIRHQKWSFERIDGGVRGDQRQASIDRFSAPGSDSFVFLLCTRAGGVGINLTAADTCIIFDSDWNPQNDLQAQSRCHRIGQKKSVKIYRLVTRNTYEREMFDRASMKLGLDKALLNRMDSSGQSNNMLTNQKQQAASLSKTEIEELLKKGAYGAFMDDDASKQFCEEDIDQILERRTMVIRHDNTSEKGSIFSKASFQADNSHNVDVNDPDFWDKVAKQAELEVVEEIPEELLILDEPRHRRQRQRFGQHDDSHPQSDSDSGDPSFQQSSRPTDLKGWSLSDRTKLERAMMQHGYGNWQEINEHIPRRSIPHLRAVCRWILIRALRTCTTVEKDVAMDVRRQLAIYPPITSFESAMVEPGPVPIEDDEFEPLVPDLVEADLPYPGADDREHYECLSFFKEAAPEYIDHIDRKAKNLLIRAALMYNIRHRFFPNPQMHMPKMLGSTPAPWWGTTEDKDLMIGLCRYGYLQYSRIWEDEGLCFYERFKVVAGKELEVTAADDEHSNLGLLEGETEQDIDASVVVDAEGDDMDVDAEGDDMQVDHLPVPTTATDGVKRAYEIPGATELGVRIRRITSALSKYRASMLKKSEAPLGTRDEKIMQRNREYFTKRHKNDFQRILVSYGVVRIPGTNLHDWDIFRGLSDLASKSDAAMEDYFHKVLRSSHEIIAIQETGQAPAKTNLIDQEEIENLTYERAKKVLRRVEYFNNLRDFVIPDPDLKAKLVQVRKHGRAMLPKWWSFDYDEALIYGLARFGSARSDLIINEPDLPFHKIHEDFLEYCKQREQRKKRPVVPVPAPDRFDDKFWMRESVSIKRMEMIVSACLKTTDKKDDNLFDSGSDDEEQVKIPRLKLTMHQPKSETAKNDTTSGDDSSDGDTDELLDQAAARLGVGMKRKKFDPATFMAGVQRTIKKGGIAIPTTPVGGQAVHSQASLHSILADPSPIHSAQKPADVKAGDREDKERHGLDIDLLLNH